MERFTDGWQDMTTPQQTGAAMAQQPPAPQPFEPASMPEGAAYSQPTPGWGQPLAQQTPVSAAREQVAAVRKNGDGDIVELKLTSGRVVDYKTAQAMAKNNEIENLQVFRGRDGDEHLRSTPDGRKDNNLDSMPLF